MTDAETAAAEIADDDGLAELIKRPFRELWFFVFRLVATRVDMTWYVRWLVMRRIPRDVAAFMIAPDVIDAVRTAIDLGLSGEEVRQAIKRSAPAPIP